jgi:hypothetical protein
MQLQDFQRGIDFTALPGNLAAGGDHNSLVDLSVPYDDGSGAGKGVVLTTTDVALNTPVVPDPTALGFTKWTRYLWNRIPFAGSLGKAQIYAWNPERASNVTLLRWELQTVNVDQVNQDVSDAVTTASNALIAANSALTTASTAASAASTASTAAALAQATANAADVTGTNAQLTATLAQTTATNAGTLAATANANAIAQVPYTKLTPGATAGMQYRSNIGNTAMEFFLPFNNYVLITETQAVNVAGKNIFGSNNTVVWIGSNSSFRALNNIVQNGQVGNNYITSIDSAQGTFTLIPGTYYIKAIAMIGPTAATKHMLTLKNVTAASWPLQGMSHVASAGASNVQAVMNGFITIVSNTTFALDHVCNTAGSNWGNATNAGPGVFPEIYTTLEIFRLQ